MGWIKTRHAQKLFVRVKFTGNPYSYVCEWPPLKYTQTCVWVCRNSYTGTQTVDSARLVLVPMWTQPSERVTTYCATKPHMQSIHSAATY